MLTGSLTTGTRMRVDGFDWTEGNRSKCEKHGVSDATIETVFRGELMVLPDPAHSKSEERFKTIGRTDQGRAVFVVFTFRKRCNRTLIRPISARYITGKKSNTMKKKLPRFRGDREAEEFVDKADLTEYDLSEMQRFRFEFQPKSERVNMRLPRQLLDAVRSSAAKAGVPYQRFIRQALEEAVQRKRA